ncbi:MAG: HD-GYP domain-containing protein [Rectinemataceae bacterium]
MASSLIAILAASILALVFLGLWLSARGKLASLTAAASAVPAPAPVDPDSRLEALREEFIGSQKEIIFTLSELVEFRTRESETHVERVAEFARIFAEILGLDAKEALLLTEAAPMHDIGKIGLSDYIIHKPGALTTEELEMMRDHTQIGHDILARHHGPLFQRAATIALEHHERWDGSGYPRGLKGEAISLSGRIVALCDVFDSLSNPRSYKAAWALEKTVEFVKDSAGHHFDPKLVDAMSGNMDRFLKVLVRMRDR